jgi:hypothetical protein
MVHSQETAIARGSSRLRSIRELLDGDDICRDIVHYFIRHSEAADTASGIAEWWINRDVAQTARALTKLRESGVVRSHLVQDATSVYAFTKNNLLRKTLRQYVDGLPSTMSMDPSLMSRIR